MPRLRILEVNCRDGQRRVRLFRGRLGRPRRARREVGREMQCQRREMQITKWLLLQC